MRKENNRLDSSLWTDFGRDPKRRKGQALFRLLQIIIPVDPSRVFVPSNPVHRLSLSLSLFSSLVDIFRWHFGVRKYKEPRHGPLSLPLPSNDERENKVKNKKKKRGRRQSNTTTRNYKKKGSKMQTGGFHENSQAMTMEANVVTWPFFFHFLLRLFGVL